MTHADVCMHREGLIDLIALVSCDKRRFFGWSRPTCPTESLHTLLGFDGDRHEIMRECAAQVDERWGSRRKVVIITCLRRLHIYISCDGMRCTDCLPTLPFEPSRLFAMNYIARITYGCVKTFMWENPVGKTITCEESYRIRLIWTFCPEI